MSIADRIQALRKMKGLSQEALADHIGVSRQAVSKWESEQSVPDLDRVVMMSDLFDVTTDYILKGIEPAEAADKRPDARIFMVVATVLNLIGLTVSCAMWYERQTAIALVVGVVFMALGCMVFGVGMLNAAEGTKCKAKYAFWSLNIWLLLFIPLSFVYNVLLAGQGAPYPLLVSPAIAYPIFWLVYIGACLSVVFGVVKAWRRA